MNKRTNVYEKSNELHVKTVILYADSSKALFYDEAAKTDKVLKDDLLDLFLKGVTISHSGKYYAPVCYSTSGLVANDGTSTALTFTGATA